RNRTPLRNAKQCEAVRAGRFDNAFEIVHKSFERDIVDVPIGKPVAALVVTDQSMLSGKLAEEIAPDRTLPVVFEMVEPVSGLDQRRTLPGHSVGDPDTIARSAKVNFLLGYCPRRPQGFFWIRGSYLAKKPDALASDCPDQTLLLAAVAERFANCVYTAIQRRIGDDAATPNRTN